MSLCALYAGHPALVHENYHRMTAHILGARDQLDLCFVLISWQIVLNHTLQVSPQCINQAANRVV